MTPEEAFMAEYNAATVLLGRLQARTFRGAILDVTIHPRRGIWVSMIVAVHKRRGAGSSALSFLCALADKHQVILSAKVMQLSYNAQRLLGAKGYGMAIDPLCAWYTRHGFIVSGTGTIRGMVRYPKPPKVEDGMVPN